MSNKDYLKAQLVDLKFVMGMYNMPFYRSLDELTKHFKLGMQDYTDNVFDRNPCDALSDEPCFFIYEKGYAMAKNIKRDEFKEFEEYYLEQMKQIEDRMYDKDLGIFESEEDENEYWKIVCYFWDKMKRTTDSQ